MGSNIATILSRMNHHEAIIRTEPIVMAFLDGTPIEGPIPSCVVVGPQLKAVHDEFRETHRGAESGNHEKSAQRNALRPAFNQTFIDLADFVELAARKDPALPFRAGFEYFWRRRNSASSHPTALVAPALKVNNGPERGTVICKAGSVAGARSFEVQMTYGDPTVEANWNHVEASGGGTKMVVRNLEPGRTCSLRVRAVGTSENGPWSNYITLIVT